MPPGDTPEKRGQNYSLEQSMNGSGAQARELDQSAAAAAPQREQAKGIGAAERSPEEIAAAERVLRMAKDLAGRKALW